ncbi:serine hydrolase-domain-containing protein [Aspergillus spinulosporus]
MKPKVKILCLHGRGTSGAIFKSQTSSIRSRLADLNLIFDFLDGPYSSNPAPGIDLFYPPPYYTYYAESPHNTTIDSIRSTQDWLSGVIAERGPYDLVMTFSQGAMVAAEALLMHQVEAECGEFQQVQSAIMDGAHDEEGRESKIAADEGRVGNVLPPFKSAIFICGGAPLTLLEHIGYNIPEITKARDLVSRSALAQMAGSEAILSKGSARWTASPAISSNLDMSMNLNFGLFNLSPYPSHTRDLDDNNINILQLTFNKEDEIRREISAGPTTAVPSTGSNASLNGLVKIKIPTVHIYGERDPRYIAGVQLSEVCEKRSRKEYNHGGGHEIPRFEAVSGAMADLVRWAVRAAERQGDGGG